MSQPNLPALDALGHAWGSWMWSMSWQVTLLVIVLVILDRLLVGFSARLRFTLWLLVLVRLLVPPNFTAPTGVTWWFSDQIIAANQVLSSTLDGWLDLSPGGMSNGEISGASAPAADGTATPPLASGVPVAPASTTSSNLPSDSLTWTSILFVLWIGIVAARLSFLLYGWYQVRKWLRTAIVIADPAALGMLESARARVGLQRPIALCDSHACATPLVTGWVRPIILLPSNVRQSLSPAELEAVLVHELAHVARGDGWIRIVQALLSAIYFFHPALWLANWYLRRTCEDACDEQTIAALAGRRRPYAEAIVKAATVAGYEPPYLALNMLDNGYPVKRRLQRILDPQLPFADGGSLGRWGFAAAAAMVLLPSGLPTTLATPPEPPGVLEFRSPPREVAIHPSSTDPLSNDLPNQDPLDEDPPENQAVNLEDQAQRLEAEALAKLESIDFQERMAGYASLERVGTQRSLSRLETAFLERSGIEQDAAKRALDAVWQQIRSTPAGSAPFSRIFQIPQEN